MKDKILLIEQAMFSFNIEKECENLTEALEVKENENTLLVKHVPCTILGKKNLNGRIYPHTMMKKSIEDARKQIEARSLLCQAHDHPEGTFVKPIEASHLVVNAYIEDVKGLGPVLFNDWEILPTSHGKDLAALIDANVSLGTSIRGLGNMTGDVVNNYDFLGTDVVGNPSSGTYTGMFESAKVSKVSRDELQEAIEHNYDEFSNQMEIYNKIVDVIPTAFDNLVNKFESINLDTDDIRSLMLDEVVSLLSDVDVSSSVIDSDLDAALVSKIGTQWQEDLINAIRSKKTNSENNNDSLNVKTSTEESVDNKLNDDLKQTNLGESKMAQVSNFDLPELKNLQKGDDATAIHQNPAPIDRPLEAITAEETPDKGELKAGPNDTVGYAPSAEDIKKIKLQAYDTNNVLAREKNKLAERCQELAQMLNDSRKDLAETAEKYNESQNLVKSLVEQLSVYRESLGGKEPEVVKAEYEKTIADLKESNEREWNQRKEKSVKYVQNLMKESTEKYAQLAESYEGKLATKDSEIADLNKKLEESANEIRSTKAEAYLKETNLKEAAKAQAKENQKKVAVKAAALNEKLVKESVTLINKALEESAKVHVKLTDQINAQKALFEEVNKYFDIACIINDSLSEALTEECEERCCKRRKESQARKLRGHR